MRENGRNDRPTNTGDAQPCLNDVYKNGTRARRRQADAVLSGRSMVEMLGVLAIIGVLSVGAIAGYSKAMLKYKLNKQTEQLTTFLNNVFIHSSAFNLSIPTSGVNSLQLIPYFIKLQYVPDEMILPANSPYRDTMLKDIFGNTISINLVQTTDYRINYMNLSFDSNNSVDVCANVANILYNFHSYVDQITFNSDNGNSSFQGDASCKGDKACFKDVLQSDIFSLCKNCTSLFVEFNFSYT